MMRSAGLAWLCACVLFGLPAMAQVSGLKGHDVSTPVDIRSDRLEVRQSDNMAIFEGNVRAVQADLRIEADRVAVHFENKGQSTDPEVTRLDVTGHVRFRSPQETASGDWAVYDVATRKVVIGGNVILAREDNEIRGERLEMDLVSGVSTFGGEAESAGRVKGRFSVPKKPDNPS